MIKSIVGIYAILLCLQCNADLRPSPETPEKLYLELIKHCVTDTVYNDFKQRDPWAWPSPEEFKNVPIGNKQSIVGFHAIDKIEELMDDIRLQNIPGDFIETGVWRGGLTIFMRAYLKAYGDTTRTVWVADSFKGVPPPNAKKYPEDKGINLFSVPWLAVSLKDVKKNFDRYGLLDNQVVFLEGWFSQTLPKAPIKSLAIMRLDGDLYESTMDALVNLYPKLSVGGYVLIDDYGAIPACAKAVHDFRQANNIVDVMTWVDWTVVYWQRTK